jgi:hypothetical protein
MNRLAAYPAMALAALGLLAGAWHAASQQRMDEMSQNCMQNYPGYDPSDPPVWIVAEVEQAWNTPLDPDLSLVGGADAYGWARLCLDQDDQPGILRGSYRDISTWYDGRWRLRDPNGQKLPADILQTHYISHYSPGEGLYLYPLKEVPPPVPYLVAEPIDPEGFRPTPKDR